MPCDMDGRRIMVTNGDIGGEGGGGFGIFVVTSFLKGHLKIFDHDVIKSLYY